jgi:hypothetical protein
MTQEEREIPNTNEIKLFMHCGKCMDDKPATLTPMEWSKTQAGWTTMGFQVWCNRCEVNIIHMDFGGVKHHANATRIADENGK